MISVDTTPRNVPKDVPAPKWCPGYHRAGHLVPVTQFYNDRSALDGLDGSCATCRCNEVLDYQKTEKGKATHRQAYARYQKTEKGKATQAHYIKTEKGKASRTAIMKRHYKTEKGKATLARQLQRRTFLYGTYAEYQRMVKAGTEKEFRNTELYQQRLQEWNATHPPGWWRNEL